MAAKFLKRLRAKKNRKVESSIDKPIEAPRSASTDATDPIVDNVDTPDDQTQKYNGSVSRDGKPVISSVTAEHFRPSDVAGTSLKAQGRGYKETRATTVPTARNSAFAGPPRYDWVDVVSSILDTILNEFLLTISKLYSSNLAFQWLVGVFCCDQSAIGIPSQ